MIERRCFWRQLTEDDVQVGDDDQRDRCSDRQPHRCFDREGQIGEEIGEHVAHGRFGDPAEAEAGERNSKLARRQHAGDI